MLLIKALVLNYAHADGYTRRIFSTDNESVEAVVQEQVYVRTRCLA